MQTNKNDHSHSWPFIGNNNLMTAVLYTIKKIGFFRIGYGMNGFLLVGSANAAGKTLITNDETESAICMKAFIRFRCNIDIRKNCSYLQVKPRSNTNFSEKIQNIKL